MRNKLLLISLIFGLSFGMASAAPTSTGNIFRTLLPESNNLYNLGASGRIWANTFFGTSTVNKLILATQGTCPQIYADNDTNTGIGFAGPDTLQLCTSGTPQVTINSMGNVGIGTTTPSQPLTVVGTSTFSGNVGIGTTTPSTALDVVGRITADYAQGIYSRFSTGASVMLTQVNTGNLGVTNGTANTNIFGSSLNGWQVGNSSAGISGSGVTPNARQVAITASSTEAIRIVSIATTSTPFVGIGTAVPTSLLNVSNNNSLTDTTNGVTITQNGTGDSVLQFSLPGLARWMMGIDNSDGDKFKIAGLGGITGLDTNTRLTIDSSGNVGIGTTTPGGILDVVGTSVGGNVLAYIRNTSNTSNSGARMATEVAGTSAGNPYYSALITGGNSWSWGADNADSDSFKIGVGTTLTAATKLTINASGNVGIGTTTPSSNLHISASSPAIRLQDTVSASSSGVVDGYIVFTDSANSQYGYIGDGSTGNNNIDVYGGTTHGVSLFGGGIRALTVDTSGNVGIGTTTPAVLLHLVDGNLRVQRSSATSTIEIRGSGNAQNARLHLSEDGASGGTLMFDSTANDLSLMTGTSLEAYTKRLTILRDSGNVGIGTTTPSSALTVNLGSTNALSLFYGSRGGTQGIKIANTSTTQSSLLSFGEDAGISLTPAYIQRFGSTHATRANELEIVNGNNGTTTLQSANANMRFNVNGGTRLFINTSGNVGIGTTTPAYLLHAVNGTATTSIVSGSSASGVNRGQFCQWNGASYTITSFAANSIVPIYSTSTVCQ